MQKILISLMAIALVVGLVGAGTMAYFSDTETSSGNTFTAGTLNIALGTTSWSANFSNMKPGDTVTSTIPVNSTGSLPLDYTITTSLSGNLTWGAHPCTVTSVRVDGTSTSSDSLTAAGGTDESDVVAIDITMPAAAGNEYQGQSGTLTVTIYAVQQ